MQLHLVTDRNLIGKRSLIDVVEQAVQGGVTHVQLREKNAADNEILNLGHELKKLLARYDVPLIINDHVAIAKELNVGVHIGQSDMPIKQVRAILGEHAIIGLSVTSLIEAQHADIQIATYLGVGPVFTTTTKLDAAPALGIVGVKLIRENTMHPLIAIGGINSENFVELDSLVEGIAVVSAICVAENPKQAAANFFRG